MIIPNYGKAIIAGLAATAVMTVMMLVSPMMGMPEMNIGKMLGGFMGVGEAFGWVGHAMIGGVLALSYAMLFFSKLPGTPLLKGVLFSLVPWFVAQVFMNPMMGAGILDSNTDAPVMMVLGSLMGHLVYGAVLGLIYGGAQQPSVAVS